MKRIICALLLMCLCFCGCGKKAEPEAKKETASYPLDQSYAEMSEELYGFTAALNGKVMAFPMDYKDLVKTGWELASEEKNNKLKPGQYSVYKITNGEAETEAYFANLSKETLKLSECTVCGIYVVADSSVSAELPKGIKTGNATESAIVKAYGNPTEERKESGYDKVLVYKSSADQRAEFFLKDGLLHLVQYYNVSAPVEVNFSDVPPPQIEEYKEVSLSSDIKDFSFYLYGTTYTMPLPLSRMLEAGWIMAAKTESSVPANGTLEDAVKITYANRTLTLTLKNVADYPTIPENCFVTSIESTSDVKLDLTLANGCRVGSTKSNFEATFRKEDFTSIKTKGKYTYYTYSHESQGTLTVTTNDDTGYITSIKVESN